MLEKIIKYNTFVGLTTHIQSNKSQTQLITHKYTYNHTYTNFNNITI